jgi:hypothetical protein
MKYPVVNGIILLQVVAGVTSLVNSVQTNGSISLPLHKRDLDLQARGTHRKSDLVRKLHMNSDFREFFSSKEGCGSQD